VRNGKAAKYNPTIMNNPIIKRINKTHKRRSLARQGTISNLWKI
jgi:hypothetical protein